MTSSSIPRWVALARTGDPSAWTRLHEHFRPAVHSVALARGSVESAEDLVQESFTRALERLDELRSDEAFGPWLFQITRNLAASGHRRRSRFTVLTDVLSFRPRPTAEAKQAIEAIRALPDAYSELMAMRLIEGLTGPEIAALTDRSPGSIRVSLHRGMKLLRERMGVHDAH